MVYKKKEEKDIGSNKMSSRTEYALPFTIETLIVVSEKLPLFGLAFCVIWSIIFDFEEATKTHCEVENFAPSISSSLSFLTQKYVWQVVIALLVVQVKSCQMYLFFLSINPKYSIPLLGKFTLIIHQNYISRTLVEHQLYTDCFATQQR